jgi:hypothetical protein
MQAVRKIPSAESQRPLGNVSPFIHSESNRIGQAVVVVIGK